jgi:hypothetical protein
VSGTANSLPFKGRVRVGMGCVGGEEPIPIPAFPLKGKERLLSSVGIFN